MPVVEQPRAGAAPSTWLSAVSRPAAGSSSSTSFGPRASARATPTSLRWPWRQVGGEPVGDVVERRRSAAPSRPARPLAAVSAPGGTGRAIGVLPAAARRPRPAGCRDGQVLEQLERLERAHQAPRGPAGAAGSGSMSSPSKRDGARSTRTKPVIASMNVVLPAPFGPIRPTNVTRLDDDVDLVVGPQPAERDGQVRGSATGPQ